MRSAGGSEACGWAWGSGRILSSQNIPHRAVATTSLRINETAANREEMRELGEMEMVYG